MCVKYEIIIFTYNVNNNRALEKQWNESKREELNGGRELLQAILRYRVRMEADSDSLLNVPIIDMRTDDEQRIDEMVQNLAHLYVL